MHNTCTCTCVYVQVFTALNTCSTFNCGYSFNILQRQEVLKMKTEEAERMNQSTEKEKEYVW